MSVEELIDALDAALFTGDEFYESVRLDNLDATLARWRRRAAEIRQTLASERAP